MKLLIENILCFGLSYHTYFTKKIKNTHKILWFLLLYLGVISGIM